MTDKLGAGDQFPSLSLTIQDSLYARITDRDHGCDHECGRCHTDRSSHGHVDHPFGQS